MHPRSSTVAGGRRRHLSPFSFLVAAAIGCCLALAACGGSGSNDPSGEASGRQAAEQKAVKFAKCLREHGVDAETGTGPNGRGFSLKITGGGPHTGGPAAEGPKGPPSTEGAKGAGPPPQILRAMGACQKYRPLPRQEDLSPAEKAQQAQKTLEFARCMRSHGVNVPDPGPSGALEMSNINPQSATFEDAQRACQHLMGKAPLAIRSSRGGPGGARGGFQSSGVQSAAPAGGGEK
jgi:hypothetical protein